MRMHRRKVLHKERYRDQELKPGEYYYSRGRQEEETSMEGEGKMDREKNQERQIHFRFLPEYLPEPLAHGW